MASSSLRVTQGPVGQKRSGQGPLVRAGAQALLALVLASSTQASPTQASPIKVIPTRLSPIQVPSAPALSAPAWNPPARQLLAEAAPIPQIPRDNWKDCSFNDRLIGCQDRELPEGVRIDWRDGRSMTYQLIREGFPLSLLRDRHGGLWQRELLVQGNGVYTNRANANRIVVPLRFPCKSPLVGEVGYCRRP